MRYDVVILRQANRDLDFILNHLDSKSRRGAIAWYQQWLKACDTLKKSADSFGVAPESEDHDFTVQQFIFSTRRGLAYRVVYRILESNVYVYHIRGPGQDFAEDIDDIELPPC